ncbi:MAG TPA: copper resistance protein CopC [Burkholderiales bacterium]|nr:copper resistance protein CopC [Burkholderiales bacterium]
MHRIAGRALAALLLLALGWVPSAAHAHAVLESAQPGDGAVVAQSPAEVSLRFNEAISPVFARVLGADGKPLTLPADISAENNRLTIRLGKPLPPGTYMVSYRVVSADTHVVGGAFPFVVGKTSGTNGMNAALADADSRDDLWNTLIIIDRAIELAALLIASGGALFILLVEPPSQQHRRTISQLTGWCAIGGVIAALLSIGLQGGLMAGAAPAELLGANLWQMGIGSTRALSAAFAVPALILLWFGAQTVTRGPASALLLIGLAAAAASLVVAGHGATVEPRWLALPAWIIHVLVAAFWIGSLPPLLLSLQPTQNVGNSPRDSLTRFSRLAIPAVVLLIVAGACMAALQIGTVEALTPGSAYVTALIVKLVLVAVLLILAVRNRYILMPRLARAPNQGAITTSLSRTIALEFVIGLAVIAAAATLAQQQPPAAQTPALIERAISDDHGNHARLSIRLDPSGLAHISVRLSKSSGETLKPLDVSLELSNTGAGVEPLLRKLRSAGDEYRYDGRDLSIPGQWSVRIEAAVTDFEQSVFTAEVPVRR